MIQGLKKKLKSKTFLMLLSALTIMSLIIAYDTLTDGFSISNMTLEIPHHKEWEILELSKNEKIHLNEILDQHYHYLGKGAQSYVFHSDDNLYVLKFFKFKHLKPSLAFNFLPSISPFIEYKTGALLRIDRKINSVFNGYKVAYEAHKQESGLIFIHLNKTTNLKQNVKIFDKIGRSYLIDLDQNTFILQRRGETLKTVMINLLKKQDLKTAQTHIEQILDLYVSEYQKGIYDADFRVMNNTGFIDGKPIHLDVGNLLRKKATVESIVYKQNFNTIYTKIDHWLQKHFPEDHQKIATEMHQKYLEKIESL